MYTISCLCFDVLRIVNINVRAYANCLRIYVSNQNHFGTSLFFTCVTDKFFFEFKIVLKADKNWRGHQLASTCIFSIDGVHPTSQSSLRFLFVHWDDIFALNGRSNFRKWHFKISCKYTGCVSGSCACTVEIVHVCAIVLLKC